MQLDIHDNYFQITDPTEIEAKFSGNIDSDFLAILPAETSRIDLVMKILSAIHIPDLSQVQSLTLNPNDNISSFPSITGRKIKKLLSFGIPCDRLGLHIDYKNYRPFEFRQIQMIITADLETLSQNNQHKKILWNALKNWI